VGRHKDTGPFPSTIANGIAAKDASVDVEERREMVSAKFFL